MIKRRHTKLERLLILTILDTLSNGICRPISILYFQFNSKIRNGIHWELNIAEIGKIQRREEKNTVMK